MTVFTFDSNAQGFVFKEVSGSTNGYWTAGKLHMDGGNSWGDAYWRYELPSGYYAADGQTQITVTYHWPGNTFTGANLWFTDGTMSSAGSKGDSSPLSYTADIDDDGKELLAFGSQCSIYNNGWYTTQIEIEGMVGADGEAKELDIADVYTSSVQLGSRGSSAIYTANVHLGDQSSTGILTSGVRLG